MTNFSEKDQANFQAALLAVSLERGRADPLHVQLAAALRQLVLSGRAMSGMAVPPSRVLAAELSVSRATTLAAYDQLLAEGYLEARRGAGTFVARNLPDLAAPAAQAPAGPEPEGARDIRPFHPGMPDVTAFPHALWARYLEAAWRKPHPDLLRQPDPLGWPPLRRAIAAHLAAWRGLSCAAGQVVITSGAAEAFRLIAGLIGPARFVHVEAPCYGPMRTRLEEAGIACRPVPVDAEGFDPSLIQPNVAAVVTTPSRQYPLGMTLPLARRLALLDWAASTGGLLVEDDYDSEFRFSGQPLPALASLDQGGHTIYVGSFSKLLSPALRLSYMVVPARHLSALRAGMARQGAQASLIPQPALARFMEQGAFAAHLRRMRRLYAQRQAVLITELEAHLQGWLRVQAEPSGMHLLCPPGPRLSARAEAALPQAAARAGLELRPLAGYPGADAGLRGFALGFAAFEDEVIRASVRRLADVIREEAR